MKCKYRSTRSEVLDFAFELNKERKTEVEKVSKREERKIPQE